MQQEIELFVPGRLCLMGEHSDWAGRYRIYNDEIEKGYAIVTGIEEGIKATAKLADDFCIHYEKENNNKIVCKMDYDKLLAVAKNDNYWGYAAGVAAVIKDKFNVGGIDITITNVTLPEKKGLSSSAAICVLVARAFNKLYNLHLNINEEMNIAYQGEILTPSRCGRLDQACAYGKKPVLMCFDGDNIKVNNIKVGCDLYLVFADLMAKKDTIKILSDLNRCYPFPQNDIDKDVHKGLGSINKKLIEEAVSYIANGDLVSLGMLMTKAQENFDKYIAPACTKELTSPVLHELLSDKYIKTLTYGGKGVGSQGDGTIQFLAKDKECADLLYNYLLNVKKMQPYHLLINKSKPVTKAIIPVAGNGTRMYPITKLLRKAFLPIIDSDGILKPAIMCLLEELDNAGIEKICLIIDENDKESYDNFFFKTLSDEYIAKLSKQQLEYEKRIVDIGKKLEFVIQKEKLGLGHAVSLCESFAGSDNVLLVLGDQLYKTNNNISCTEQLLNNFLDNDKLMISVCEVPLNDVSHYGILSGTIDNNNQKFIVDKMYEKPDIEYAKEYLYTINKTEKKYYSVFGEYILTPKVFDKLRKNVKNNVRENGEIQLTSVLDEVREEDGMIAFIPDGEMLDIGNINSYKNTLIKKMGK